MLAATHLIGFGAGGGGAPVAASFIGSDVSDADQTSYTFAGKSLGTASSDRLIVVAVSYRHSTTSISSITVAGQSCTIDAGANIFVAPSGIAIGIAEVPTGATGDIVVTFASTAASCGVGWWAVTNVQSLTPVDTVESNASGTSLSLTGLATSPGGAAFFAGMDEGNTLTFTWSVATERYDEVVDAGLGHTHTGASMLTDGSTINETLTPSSSTTLAGAALSLR